MRLFRSLFAIIALATISLSGTAMADDKQAVQTLYDFLSNPASEEHAAAFEAAASEDWASLGDYSGKTKSRDAFVKQVGGFAKLIPDLNWSVEEMLQDGNQIAVRSRATGTPSGPFFGVDGKGKSFDILAIDIHTVENGQIARTFHVEDWAGALRQLGSQ